MNPLQMYVIAMCALVCAFTLFWVFIQYAQHSCGV